MQLFIMFVSVLALFIGATVTLAPGAVGLEPSGARTALGLLIVACALTMIVLERSKPVRWW